MNDDLDDKTDADTACAKRHPYFTNYLISKDGEVFSTVFRNRNVCRLRASPRRMAKRLTNMGYFHVTLSKDNTTFHRTIHVLVLEAFVGPRPEGKIAAHLNGIKADCRSCNLAWVSPRENYDHTILHGSCAGERNPNSKLTDEIDYIIRVRSALGEPTSKLADEFGVSRVCIQHVKQGKRWRAARVRKEKS